MSGSLFIETQCIPHCMYTTLHVYHTCSVYFTRATSHTLVNSKVTNIIKESEQRGELAKYLYHTDAHLCIQLIQCAWHKKLAERMI